MPVAKVLSPIGGIVWGLDTYPNGNSHIAPHCGSAAPNGKLPIDIGDVRLDDIDFIGNGRVKSIRTVQLNNCCLTANNGPWHQSVIVGLFKDQAGSPGNLIGRVLYQHLEDRVADGHYVTNRKKLGTLPIDMCEDTVGQAQCTCPRTPTTPWCCSNGVHIHMHAYDGPTVPVVRWQNTPREDMKRARTTIYKWTYSE